MTAHAAEFFTLDEVNRLKIIQVVVDRCLTTLIAAQRLSISERQCRRLLSRYRESGPLGMANRRRGKPSNNQLPDGLAQYVLNIIRERYTDFGPTLACEILAELHDVHLSKETIRSLIVKAGLWIPRKQRAPKIQQPHYRRACCGELIQIDSCDHHWFENRAPACTALVYVDDVRSRLMQLLFVCPESTLTYFEYWVYESAACIPSASCSVSELGMGKFAAISSQICDRRLSARLRITPCLVKMTVAAAHNIICNKR